MTGPRQDKPVICACCRGVDRCVRLCDCDACSKYVKREPFGRKAG